jgi:predicted nucleotidyltransferase
MTREEALDRLKRSEPEFRKAGVRHLYLFGSTLRGEAGVDSDVDLFFDYDGADFGMFDLLDVRELAAEVLGTKADMIPRDGLHRVLRLGIEAAALQVF